jgi:hypothetical protein
MIQVMPGCKPHISALPVLTYVKCAPVRFSKNTIFAAA